MVVCVACILFHVFVGVVRELMCGDVWVGFVCVLCLLVSVPCSRTCVLLVIDCVMLYVFCVSCSMFACVPCVCMYCL